MSLRAVTISRMYFLYLSCGHASVLWHLSRPTLLRTGWGVFTRSCLEVPQPRVGDGHRCQVLLLQELAASTTPCWGNILTEPQLHPGAAAWQRAGHQDETKCWMLLTIKWRGQQLCKPAGYWGALRAPGQCAGLLSKHWGSACGSWAGKGFYYRGLQMGYRTCLGHEAKAGPAPMKGAGSWQLPRSWWEPVQAQSGDRMIYHIMGCSGYCLVPSAKTLPIRWDSPLGPEQGTPCQCREMYHLLCACFLGTKARACQHSTFRNCLNQVHNFFL